MLSAHVTNKNLPPGALGSHVRYYFGAVTPTAATLCWHAGLLEWNEVKQSGVESRVVWSKCVMWLLPVPLVSVYVWVAAGISGGKEDVGLCSHQRGEEREKCIWSMNETEKQAEKSKLKRSWRDTTTLMLASLAQISVSQWRVPYFHLQWELLLLFLINRYFLTENNTSTRSHLEAASFTHSLICWPVARASFHFPKLDLSGDWAADP